MSTSFLYHGFGIVGYRYVRSEYRGGDVIFTIAKKKFGLRCPVCKNKRVIRRGSLPRWFHSLPIGKKATYIRTEVARVECKAVRQADIGFADPRSSGFSKNRNQLVLLGIYYLLGFFIIFFFHGIVFFVVFGNTSPSPEATAMMQQYMPMLLVAGLIGMALTLPLSCLSCLPRA